MLAMATLSLHRLLNKSGNLLFLSGRFGICFLSGPVQYISFEVCPHL